MGLSNKEIHCNFENYTYYSIQSIVIILADPKTKIVATNQQKNAAILFHLGLT